MTVQSTTSRADYTGNGVTTAFTVPFYFLDPTHIKVLRTQISTGVVTTLALVTDYTVSGAGSGSGGTLTALVAPTSDQKLSILRNVPLTQLIHYVPNDPFPAATHEQALDQLTMEIQQLNEGLSRALLLAANVTGVSTALPTPSANKLIGWDTSALNLQNVDPSSLLTIAGSGGFTTQQFSGTGALTAFTLSTNPGTIANLEVYISGVRQRPTLDYTVSATTLTFLAAPASGTNNILVRWGTTLNIGVPADGTVAAVKMAAGAAVGNLGFTPAASGINNDITALTAIASTFGFKNRIINGNFDVWQYGTSRTTVGYGSADRWKIDAISNITLAQQAAATPYGKFSLLITPSNASNGVTFAQTFEDTSIRDLPGGYATLSFQANCASGTQSITAVIQKSTTANDSTGGGSWTTIATQTFSLTNAVQSFSLSALIPNDGTANGLRVAFVTSNTANGVGIALWKVQFEKGATATGFDYRPFCIEQALCQRYLPAVSFSGGANPYFGAGMAFGTTAAYYTVSFPITPRVPPTGLTVSSASHFAAFLASTATSNATAVIFGGANSHSAFINLTGMSGLVGGNATLLYMNNAAALMLFTGCEL